MDIISGIAKDSSVKILSVKPNIETTVDSYSSPSFLITLSAASYHILGDFISKIENHKELQIEIAKSAWAIAPYIKELDTWTYYADPGKIKEYLAGLEKLPEKKVIDKYLGIICSESTGLPILQDQELPPVKLEGMSFDPIQNIQAKTMTKVTLLLVVESESKKLGIWHEMQSLWTEKYTQETKKYVQIIEMIAKQCENTRQRDKVEDLRKSINLIKEANTQYSIDW